MKLNKLLTASAVSSMLLMGAAHAAPVTINTATFADPYTSGDADSVTAPAAFFTLNWSATSTYTDTNNSLALDAGDTVTDSGFGTVALANAANSLLGVNATEGLGAVYGLRFSYSGLTGIVSAVLPQNSDTLGVGAVYNPGGLINLYADITENPADTENAFNDSDDVLLMTLQVLGSDGGIGNFTLYSKVIYALGNTFSIAGFDVNDIVALNGVGAIADFNNAGPYPDVTGSNPLTWARTSTLNGNLEFQVPEPGVLALLGLGLAGLGLARRNKKQAS